MNGAWSRRGLARNTSSNLAGSVFTLAILFFLTPFVAHRLGGRDYSLWVVATAAIGYAQFLDLGTGAAVTKYVAQYSAIGNWERCRRVAGTALALSLALGLVACGITALLAPVLARAFADGSAAEGRATWVFLLVGVSLAVAIPASTSLAVLRGLQRFDLVNAVSAFGMVLTAAGTVIALTAGGGLIALAAISAPLELFIQIPMIWLIRRSAPELRFPTAKIERSSIRALVSFASAQFLIRIGSQVRGRSDEVVVGAVLPLARVGPYAIARRLSELPAIVSVQLETLIPLASQLGARDDRTRLRTTLTTATRISMSSSAMLAIVIAGLAQPFLVLWVGPSFAGSADLVPIFVATGLVSTMYWPAQWMLIGMGKQRLPAIAAIGSAAVKIVLAVALATQFGTTGVAASTLIATCLGGLALVLPFGLHAAGVTARQALMHIMLPAALPAVPAVAVLAVLRYVLSPTSLAEVAAVALLTLAVYLATYALLPATAPERELMRDLFARSSPPTAQA